eukprot:3197222-Amphidinium_carterae.1
MDRIGMQLMLVRDELQAGVLSAMSGPRPWTEFIRHVCKVNLENGVPLDSGGAHAWSWIVKEAAAAVHISQSCSSRTIVPTLRPLAAWHDAVIHKRSGCETLTWSLRGGKSLFRGTQQRRAVSVPSIFPRYSASLSPGQTLVCQSRKHSKVIDALHPNSTHLLEGFIHTETHAEDA